MTDPPAVPGPTNAGESLKAPAILLIVISAGMILIFILDFFLFALGGGAIFRELRDPQIVKLMQWFMPLVCVCAAALNAFALFCAVQMLRLKSWGLSMAGVVVSAVPISTSICCIFSLPVAIWAFVLLMKPEVKAAFR